MRSPLFIDAEWQVLPTAHLPGIEICEALMRGKAIIGSVVRQFASDETLATAFLDGGRLALGPFATDSSARAAVEEAADAITYCTLERLRTLPVPMRNNQ